MKQDMIVILDLGSTENTVLAREIRTLGVYSEIHPHDITVEELQALDNVKGIILNGGENRVVDGAAVDIRPELYALGYPMISVDQMCIRDRHDDSCSMCGKFCAVRSMNKALAGEHIDIL